MVFVNTIEPQTQNIFFYYFLFFPQKTIFWLFNVKRLQFYYFISGTFITFSDFTFILLTQLKLSVSWKSHYNRDFMSQFVSMTVYHYKVNYECMYESVGRWPYAYSWLTHGNHAIYPAVIHSCVVCEWDR